MAVTSSGVYGITIRDILNQSSDLNLTDTNHQVSLHTNALIPNFSIDTTYNTAGYTSNEVSGTGYIAGGNVLATPTLTAAAGNITYDAQDASWPGSTITNARCAVIHAAAAPGDNLITLINFGADFSTTAGTFSIQWNVSGIWTLRLVI